MNVLKGLNKCSCQSNLLHLLRFFLLIYPAMYGTQQGTGSGGHSFISALHSCQIFLLCPYVYLTQQCSSLIRSPTFRYQISMSSKITYTFLRHSVLILLNEFKHFTQSYIIYILYSLSVYQSMRYVCSQSSSLNNCSEMHHLRYINQFILRK